MNRLRLVLLVLLVPFIAFAEERDAGFTSSPIDSVVFARMKGKSYKDNCTIPLSELRYLRVLHYDFDGNVCQGELVCNKLISIDLLEIFEALFNARYPIEHVVLIDDYDADDEHSMTANNTSCFNFRTVAGTNKLSAHSRGMAIDINPLYNPHVKQVRGKTVVSPSAARPYADRSKTFPHKIDRQDLCYKLFVAHGFRWGGAWRSSKDYQHFEK
ncbi:MAG: M15 family metallopeptidase [Bacteroidaceae bacterium]|nr:M15 family metallopeptidase [Bacteroidaceae bacterium]